MKLNLLAFALLLTTFAQASHITGGEITWSCLPNGQYKFKLALFRDCTGTPLNSPTETLSSNAGVTITCTKTQVIYLNKECNAPSCIGASIPYAGAIEKHIYESAPITLTGSPPPTGWYFTWNTCCRSAPISNLSNASSQGVSLLATMYPYFPPGATFPQTSAQCYDSSPAFEESPNLVFCSATNSNYYGSTTDVNGDSTFYELSASFSSGVVPPLSVVNYSLGYSASSPLPGTAQNSGNIPAVINPSSGNVAFKSFNAGNFATNVKVSSYRNGQLIAQVYRDALIFIKPCTSTGMCAAPLNYSTISMSFSSPADSLFLVSGGATSGFDTYQRVGKAMQGDSVKFTFTANDLDLTGNCFPEQIEIKAVGSFMSLQSANYANDSLCDGGFPCATLQSLNGSGLFVNTVQNSISFLWVPNCNLDGYKNAEFYFDVINNSCPQPTVKRVKVSIPLNMPTFVQNPVFDTTLSTLNSAGNIELYWNKPDTANHFSHYVLWHQNGTNSASILDTIANYTDTNYVHVAPQSGINKYWIRSVGGCLNVLDSLQIFGDTVSTIQFKNSIGIEEQLMRLHVYPQPFTNQVVFQGFENDAAINVQVLDVAGRLLLQEKTAAKDEKIVIQTTELKQGVYVFVLSWADYSTAIKLVKHE